MPVISKAVLGAGGRAYNVAELFESYLKKSGYTVQSVGSDYRSRSFVHSIRVQSTVVTISYNSTFPGFATIRYTAGKSGESVVARTLLRAARNGKVTPLFMGRLKKKIKVK